MTYKYVQSATDLGPAKGPRLAFVWHMAEGGGTVGFLAKPNPNGVSVHFVVQYSGNIVQMLPLDHMHSSLRPSAIRGTDDAPYQYRGETITYGATAARRIMGKWADMRDSLGPNHASIAAEVEGFAATGPNDAQTSAIAKLGRDLGLPALGHRDFQSYKACPGHQFPWFILGGHAQKVADDMPGLQFRFIDRVSGVATVIGDDHAIIRVDNAGFVAVPAGQKREVAGTVELTEAVPGHPNIAAGTKARLIGNIPGNTPDNSIAAILLVKDSSFVADPGQDCSAWETWYALAPK